MVVLWDKKNLKYLVEGNNEGGLLLLEQIYALNCLGLQAMHDVHHQDSNVTETAAP